ncbi:MAG: exo-alpha-sialidase, partial [Acidobacteriota bacterium]
MSPAKPLCSSKTLRRVVAFASALLIGVLAVGQVLRDPDVQVDQPGELSERGLEHEVSVDVEGSEVYASFVRKRYLLGHDAFFNVSVNQAGTWRSVDQRLNTQFRPGTFEADTEKAFVSSSGDGHVYVGMVNRLAIRKDVYVNASSDGGQTWSGPVDVTRYFGQSADAADHQLASTTGGRAHLVWVDDRGGFFISGLVSVWISSTLDGGQTWLPKQKVNIDPATGNESTERSSQPTSCADGTGRVLVAWRDKRNPNPNLSAPIPGRIVLRRSEDDGQTFTPIDVETRLDTGDVIETESEEPDMACLSDGTVVVVWQDQRGVDGDIYFNRRTNGGVDWLAASERLDLDSPAGANASRPKIELAPDGRIVVAWEDDRDGGVDLYSSYSDDGGLSWAPAQRVNTGTTPGSIPVVGWDLAIDGQLVSVAWTDARDDPIDLTRRDVYLVRSEDGGVTFGPAQRLDLGDAPGASDSDFLVADADAGGVVAVWSDFRSDPDHSDVLSGGIGAAFDLADADADGIPLGIDNCPNYPNDDQANRDGDGRGTACDAFPDDPENDIDLDGYSAGDDKCPDTRDSLQDDTDDDGIGDLCDTCSLDPDLVGRDLDGDGLGD